MKKDLLKALKLGLKYTEELSGIYNESTGLSVKTKEELLNGINFIKSTISKHAKAPRKSNSVHR